MPLRKVPLVTDQIYHVFNRGVASQPIFQTERDYRKLLELMSYYQNENPPTRYSFFIKLERMERETIIEKLKLDKNILVEIITYCLMPNHLHLLLKQLKENGISAFMAHFTDSYTRYFNTKYKRAGPLYQGRFQAVRIETDEQLLHVSRYIHLNPHTGYVVNDLDALKNYQYSSFPEYLGLAQNNFCSKEIILHQFKNPESYTQFIFDHADYQRQLHKIKHLILE